jgi:glycosyltransferase involved in cell wall biosynthesis
MSDKPICLVTAPVATRSGYGAHSRDICRSLIKLDRYDVRIWPVRWGSTPMNALHKDDPNDIIIIERLLESPNIERQPEIHIHIVIPTEFQPVGKYNIGITAGLETNLCKPEWIQGMNKMNLNLVPSKFVHNTLSQIAYNIQDDKTQQVTGQLKNEKPLEVLFEGADTNIYKKTNKFSKSLVEEMDKVDEKFNFLYVGHWLQGNLGEDRKDTGMLVKVFLETFKNMKNKPALIMKTSGAGYSVLDRETMLNKIQEIKDTIDGDLPNVYLFHGDFMDEEINELYNHPKVKAHISLTHGEGYGRPLLEASLSEKPVIAPDWSGHIDFLSKSNAILLGGVLEDVSKNSFPENFYQEGMKWFTVNYQEASVKMKDVYKSYRKYTLNAKKLTMFNKSKFSLDSMTVEFGKILDKYVPEFPKEVKLELPKLNKVSEVEAPKIKLPKLKKV